MTLAGPALPELFVQRIGERTGEPALVLVHGAPDRSRSFEPTVALLPDLALTLYDRRGYGRSVAASRPAGSAVVLGGFDVHARDLIALLDERPAFVCGHSLGGTIALMAASMRPDLFLSIGAWEPPMPWEPWYGIGQAALSRWLRLADDEIGEAFSRHLLGDARWNQLSLATRAQLRAEGPALARDLASQATRPFELSDIKVPAIIGCGSVEPRRVTGNRHLAHVLDARLIVVDGADHYVQRTAPADWAEFIRRTHQSRTR